MPTYLQSIKNSAIAILDGGRPWDGGLFKLIGDNKVLYNAVTNGTVDRRLITGDIKVTMLSGGSLIAIVFTVMLLLTLLAIIITSVYCRCRSTSKKYLRSKSYQTRVNRINQQLPVSLRLLLAILCTVVLILALVPLVLAFAANSRLHASVSDVETTRSGTVANQIHQVFSHIDAFLKNLVPEAKVDIQPVIQRTLEMTSDMKLKSQTAYQNEFRDVIGANNLTDSSTDLLYRIRLYYYAGKSFKEDFDRVNSALSDLKREKLFSFEEDCHRYFEPNTMHICRNHTQAVGKVHQYISSVVRNWTEPTDGRTLQEQTRDLTTFLYNLVGALDATGNTPDKQLEMKEQKLRMSVEFNQNISSVFDRELNSTAFVLSGVDEKLSELDEKIQSARNSLQNASRRVHDSYAKYSSKFESIRFGATTAICVLLLITLTILSTSAAIILLVPNAAKAQTRGLICSVYVSYASYAVALLLVCLLFCATSYLHTETCRYLYEEKIADKFLVPEVNAVIAELKMQAASDPNKTDAIPLKRIDRLIGGLLDGCQANQPIVVAMNAVRYIDTEISDSAEQSLQFKLKGREILRREMSTANLEQLRDGKMEENMKNLRNIFIKYNEYNFSSVGVQLAEQTGLLEASEQLVLLLKKLNEEADALVKNSERSTKQLLESNREVIEMALHAISTLFNFTRHYSPETQLLEDKKAVVSVIDSVITSNRVMDSYLSNQTAWTEAAVKYYTKHVINGGTNESKAIADSTAIGFLSAIGKCREIYNFYRALVGIPCQSLLYPLSILWFCLAWFLWFAALLSVLVHVSLSCFVDSMSASDQQQQQQPLDDTIQLSRRLMPVSNDDPATKNSLLS